MIFLKLYFHIWSIAKSWLNCLVDDFEQHHKIEKITKIIIYFYVTIIIIIFKIHLWIFKHTF
jgi:uncharacterized membrane protein YbaN (DUF454 family)